MSEKTTPQTEEKPVIDLGTNAVFRTTYKTIRCANGKTYTISQREIVEPELPERKRPKKRGPGRPKKVKDPVPKEDNPDLDMDSLMEEAKKAVD